jgi:hypothetical protein
VNTLSTVARSIGALVLIGGEFFVWKFLNNTPAASPVAPRLPIELITLSRVTTIGREVFEELVDELFTETVGLDENELDEDDDLENELDEDDDLPPKLPPLASTKDDNSNKTTKMQLVINVVNFFIFTSFCCI